ncbi:MAG: hypothetical protein QOE05_3221 [Actinomycetota bacterium]|nr:hypothetical protein [Actinomycetota bacterium]
MRRHHSVIISLVTAVFVLAPTAANAVVPTPPRSYASAIEALSPYVAQSTCSPTAKPGVVAWRDQLLRTYTWSRSLGIVRACDVGGRSEHKEGRALDWGVSASSSRDVAAVNSVIAWLLATDRYGNKYAMARRLGIMYIIWNHKIWGAYNASQGWRTYTGSNPHTDHVHFSFAWAGANKQTSYWTGKVANISGGTTGGTSGGETGTVVMPDDEIANEPQPPSVLPVGQALSDEDALYLDARRQTGTTTHYSLKAGQPYLVEVRGTYQYRTGSRADAECSMTASSSTSWARTRSLDPRHPDADFLDVYLDGIDGRFVTDNGATCDNANHMYRWTYVPQRTGRANFRIWDAHFSDNSGGLAIRVVRLNTDDSDTSFSLNAASPYGSTAKTRFREGVDYVVEVAGTWKYSAAGTGDAECIALPAGWSRTTAGGGDVVGALLNADDYSGRALLDTGGRCDAQTHTYRYQWRPTRDTALTAKVYDTGYKDNSGALKVRVVRADLAPMRLSGPPEPPAETVHVDTTDADGVTTAGWYHAGSTYEVVVTGTYDAGAGVVADAECTATTTDAVWRSRRASTLSSAYLWDATVDGRTRDWVPLSGSGACSPTHEYKLLYTPGSDGHLQLGVRDVTFADNAGTLTVTVKKA